MAKYKFQNGFIVWNLGFGIWDLEIDEQRYAVQVSDTTMTSRRRMLVTKN